MNKPKSKSNAGQSGPRLGGNVIVRTPFFARPIAGICICIYEDEPVEIAVQVFPVGREPLQIPSVPYFDSEPESAIRSAAWLAF
ncbi:hypothetical protein FCJ61_04050 [Burkholderia metallica]|uniref:hypothetical protein n=1 Tax=Burkholderia metallica TaxID=488729 RepID=UPI00157B1482|nr:hypothetical protein [Burkholderia metallica]NTZ82210.1 hypothetical protein [Burkholderia metallica]